MSSWYSDHPVVSTVLWLMGGTNTNDVEEDEEKKPTRCLSWRDEHDGSPIAEYMTSPKIPRTEVKFNNVEEANKSISKKKSLPVLPRSDSDVDKYADGRNDNEDLMSPQWGWYVSTTPPQDLYGQRPRNM